MQELKLSVGSSTQRRTDSQQQLFKPCDWTILEMDPPAPISVPKNPLMYFP